MIYLFPRINCYGSQRAFTSTRDSFPLFPTAERVGFSHLALAMVQIKEEMGKLFFLLYIPLFTLLYTCISHFDMINMTLSLKFTICLP